MTAVSGLETRRPARADARRNYDALIGAARQAFAELGTDAPLEEIARRAEVGIATLYRNFPTRDELIEAVYLEEVEAIAVAAEEFAKLPPFEALRNWLGRFTGYVGTKRALVASLNRNSPALKNCRDALYAAGSPLLERAQAAGEVRTDVGIDDVLRMVTGISGYAFADLEQQYRVLSIALDGLRAPPSTTS
jgi:AcrR family transcriptional regulator